VCTSYVLFAAVNSCGVLVYGCISPKKTSRSRTMSVRGEKSFRALAVGTRWDFPTPWGPSRRTELEPPVETVWSIRSEKSTVQKLEVRTENTNKNIMFLTLFEWYSYPAFLYTVHRSQSISCFEDWSKFLAWEMKELVSSFRTLLLQLQSKANWEFSTIT